MAIYAYICEHCGAERDVIIKMKNLGKHPVICLECGQEMKRKRTGFNFRISPFGGRMKDSGRE